MDHRHSHGDHAADGYASPLSERERSDLTAEMLLTMAGFPYLAVGETAELDNGAWAERTEHGVVIGGGR